MVTLCRCRVCINKFPLRKLPTKKGSEGALGGYRGLYLCQACICVSRVCKTDDEKPVNEGAGRGVLQFKIFFFFFKEEEKETAKLSTPLLRPTI